MYVWRELRGTYVTSIRERKGNSERRDSLKKGERSSMLDGVVHTVCVWRKVCGKMCIAH